MWQLDDDERDKRLLGAEEIAADDAHRHDFEKIEHDLDGNLAATIKQIGHCLVHIHDLRRHKHRVRLHHRRHRRHLRRFLQLSQSARGRFNAILPHIK